MTRKVKLGLVPAALAALLSVCTTLMAASFTGGAGDGCERRGMSSYVDLGPVNVWKFKFAGGSGDGHDANAMTVYKQLAKQGTMIILR